MFATHKKITPAKPRKAHTTARERNASQRRSTRRIRGQVKRKTRQTGNYTKTSKPRAAIDEAPRKSPTTKAPTAPERTTHYSVEARRP